MADHLTAHAAPSAAPAAKRHGRHSGDGTPVQRGVTVTVSPLGVGELHGLGFGRACAGRSIAIQE